MGQCGEAPGKPRAFGGCADSDCALTGSADIDLSVRRLYLMCADNGVVAQNVTQTGSEVSARMADSFAAGKKQRLQDGKGGELSG